MRIYFLLARASASCKKSAGNEIFPIENHRLEEPNVNCEEFKDDYYQKIKDHQFLSFDKNRTKICFSKIDKVLTATAGKSGPRNGFVVVVVVFVSDFFDSYLFTEQSFTFCEEEAAELNKIEKFSCSVKTIGKGKKYDINCTSTQRVRCCILRLQNAGLNIHRYWGKCPDNEHKHLNRFLQVEDPKFENGCSLKIKSKVKEDFKVPGHSIQPESNQF